MAKNAIEVLLNQIENPTNREKIMKIFSTNLYLGNT